MARIVTVYSSSYRRFRPVDMSYIRWLKMSEALAEAGHEVDIATNEPGWLWRSSLVMRSRCRRVPLGRVRWHRYDVVKTLFGKGFETLEEYGGGGHPFVIAKLGSVVGPADMPGIYFFGAQRERMFAVQRRIHSHSRYVTVVSEPARTLWHQCFGPGDNVLVVPGATDDEIPPKGPDPFPRGGERRCLFAGNVYTPRSQPEANRALIDKLNALGGALARRGMRLYLLGVGEVGRLDRDAVTYLGSVPYGRSWDYLRHADVGVVVSAGAFMHNNESSKIYHYLRVGLPVVSEAGFPNDQVVTESGCGLVVAAGDMPAMAEAIEQAAVRPWDRDRAVRSIREHHTWRERAKVYDQLLPRTGGPPTSAPWGGAGTSRMR
jgi:glycosyltransferase involved in cell wall biosynthesis